jgi:hypothetical protein
MFVMLSLYATCASTKKLLKSALLHQKSYPGFVAPELFLPKNFFCLPVYRKTSKGVMATLRPPFQKERQ